MKLAIVKRGGRGEKKRRSEWGREREERGGKDRGREGQREGETSPS
jgi:hypothetical protein